MRIVLKIATDEYYKLQNPRHSFGSQHLRDVQAKFHRNPPNFGTLLIHLSD